MFPRNHWWAVAESRELGKRPLRLQRFGEWLTFWRDDQGVAHCVPDRCPHRGASLARGRVVDGCLECPFHAFRFDGAGRCTLAPSEGKSPEHRPALDTQGYALKEQRGLVFLWWGDEAANGEPPWFDLIDERYHGSGFTVEWKINYMRATEVQLDWAHLPFVHHNSIGFRFDPAIDLDMDLDGDHLRTWDRRFETETGEPSFYLHLAFPNLWMNPIRKGMFGMLALVPIDEERTCLYVRLYQNRVTVPVLRSVFSWAMNVVNGFITNQDKLVVESQPNTATQDIRHERLTASDRPIAAYRKEMKRRLAGQRGDDESS